MAALEGLGYAVDWVDRGSYWREDPAQVVRLHARDDARALLIARDMPVLRNGETGLDSLLPMSEIEALGGAQVEALLGLASSGAPVFAALMPDAAVEMRSDCERRLSRPAGSGRAGSRRSETCRLAIDRHERPLAA